MPIIFIRVKDVWLQSLIIEITMFMGTSISSIRGKLDTVVMS